MNNTLSYIAIAVLLVISAFFSSSEMAFSSISSLRLKSINENKKSVSSLLALRIKEKYENSLSAILIGNNLANSASSAVATVIVIGLLGDNYAWVSTAVMTVLVLIFGEIVPKVLAKQFTEKATLAFSIPIYMLTVVFMPITWLVMQFINLVSKLWSNKTTDTDSVSEDDLETIIDIVEDEGVLDEEQCDLLQNALGFDEVLAYQIITHRLDMEAIDIRDAYEVNLKKILESTYSRMPVYEDTPDNIIGILHLNHAFKSLVDKNKINIRKLLLPAVFVHKTMPLPDVLEKMKEAKCHMVIVLDEYGGTFGILTMEDVLEQLVGEIFDETDDIEREFVCIDDDHYEALGDMRVYDFFDEFDIDIERDEDFEGEVSTLGGFITNELEGEVEQGSVLIYKNLQITVLELEDYRILKVSVEILPEESDEEEE